MPLPPGTFFPESLRLFGLCSAMEFSVLPVAGGVYDQHPALLAQWQVIFNRKASKQKAEQAARESRR